MRLYKRFALAAVMATYFLIFVGGLVRVSGAGLGCPDWPKCFGRWFPPVSASQLPPEFAPESFNFVLAWIEYINRLIGMSVGLIILATAILALIYFRKKLAVLVPSLLAAILVAYQGWQGSQVVSSALEPYIVSIHTIIAFIIISLLIYAALEAHLAGNGATGATLPKSTLLIILLWIGTLAQVLLGTQVRGAIEHTIREYPLLFGRELIEKIGLVDELHASLGILLVLATLFVSTQMLKRSSGKSYMIQQTTWAVIGISGLQLIIGHFLVYVGLPEIIQLLHLWLASLMAGALLVLFVSVRRGGRLENI